MLVSKGEEGLRPAGLRAPAGLCHPPPGEEGLCDPPPGRGLEDLPAEVLAALAASLDRQDLASALLVSPRWRSALAPTVQRLAPAALPGAAVPLLFPGLRSLTLNRCVGSCVRDESIAALSALTRLTSLNLRQCSKLGAGGFGACVAGLSALRDLDLAACERLPGAALAAASGLLRLTRLALDKCVRVDDGALAPLGALTALRRLSLGGCYRVQGPGLRHLTGLLALSELNLGGLHDLRDEALAPLSHLSALQTLCLDRCYALTGFGLAVHAPPLLRTLSLLECEVADAGIRSLSRLVTLTSLTLGYCRHLSDQGLAGLGSLPELQALTLRGCEGLRGPGLGSFSQSLHLSTVDLSWCPQLTATGIASIGQIPHLRDLSLLNCGITDWQARELRSSSLTALNLGHSRELSCAGVEAMVASCGSLARVDLPACPRVGDRGLAALARGLPSLRSLNLIGCTLITDEGLAVVSAATNLRELNLAYSKLSNIGALSALPLLKRLHVFGCGQLHCLPPRAGPAPGPAQLAA